MSGEEAQELRLAIFAPVPPAPTGVADYVAELLPLLPDAWEIDLFVDQEPGAVDAAVQARAGIHPHPEWDRRRRDRPYDLQIYQVGNNTAHAYTLPYVTRAPGLLVLHDAMLHTSRFTDHLSRADFAGYRAVARASRPDVGRAIGHLAAAGLAGPSIFRAFPLCEDLVRASLRTVVHGEPLAAWLRGLVGPVAALAESAASAPIVETVVHWRQVPPADPARVASWRQRVGADDDSPLIGTFGYIGAAHRLDLIIEALAPLASRRAFRLVVAGAVDPTLGLEELAAAAGLGERIHWAGRLPAEDFGALMRASDLALNLRYPTARASSGTMQQLLQLGIPTVIHDLLHLTDIPPGAVARVPTGRRETELDSLAAVLDTWLADPDARVLAGRRAAAWAATEITAVAMRDSYVSAITRTLEQRPAA
jgi:glycosyltransferase involved in cell wall biosynthesis